MGQPAEERLRDLITHIGPLDEAAMTAARVRQEMLTKPPGSLGRLETLAIQLAGITGRARPRMTRKAVIIMAGDHGVTAEAVSAYPAVVTPQMVRNFLQSGAAINVLARQMEARVIIVDVGVAVDIDAVGLVNRKIAHGTRNMAMEPAMTRDETLRAIAVGLDVLQEQAAVGLDLIAVGEMGIGNTTAASAITAVVTGLPVPVVTGRGTGIDDARLGQKIAVIERALTIHRPDPTDPLDVLAKVGGLEIAALVGVMLSAAARRIPIVLDGFITGAAALVAVALCPALRSYMIPAHMSAQAGHRAILDRLQQGALLDFGMRLGEGSGATLAFPIIEAAARLSDEMATFAEAGVATANDDATST
jgi:nicotinate-nucleotide--dimethylbenzimidazole phosphoribosyltransferase